MSSIKRAKLPRPEISVRLADASDATEIARVLSEAFTPIRRHYTVEAFAAVTPGAAEVVERFKDGPIWVAERDGRLVGTVSLIIEPEGLYVRSMAVSPSAQGTGAGRLLLNALHEHGRGTGIDRVFLYSLPFEDGPVAMYRRFGYRIKRTTSAEEWHGVPGVEMEMFLSEENAA